MPPQGESIGIAIEDGLILAEIFEQRDSKTIEQLLAAYEERRRPLIERYYDEAVEYWNTVLAGSSS